MAAREPAPSWSEIAALMARVAPPAPPPPSAEQSTSKWVQGLIGALLVVFLGALGTWAGSTIAGVGQIGPKIDNLKGSLDDLKKTVDLISAQSNQQQLAIGKQDIRLTTVEQNQARLMDRMRAVEGGARIAAPPPGAVPTP